MFTGIVQAVGRIVKPDPLEIATARLPLADIRVGDSICVDGVSLTVNRVRGDTFEVNLIPHTLKVTTLKRLAPGAKVNLEVDPIARYVERVLG